MPSMRNVAYSFVFCFSSLALAESPKTIRVDRVEPVLLSVANGWAFWRTSDLFALPFQDHGPSFDHRIYRQRIPNPVATLVFTEVNAGGFNPCQASSPDGTLITINQSKTRVVWYRPDGTVLTSQKVPDQNEIEQAYSDGVLVRRNGYQWASGNIPRAVVSYFFAPFRGNTIDFKSAIELRSAAESTFSGSEPLRAGDELVWSYSEGLQFIDLNSGIRTCVTPLVGDLRHMTAGGSAVVGFDGELVMLDNGSIIEKATGKTVGKGLDTERARHLVMLHNRVGYCIRGGRLEAIVLDGLDRRPVLLESESILPVARTERGIQLWAGKKWRTIPWYISRDRD